MSDRGIERISPRQWAAQGRLLQMSLPLSGMARLVASTRAVEGDAQIDLCFSMDEERRAIIRGSVSALVVLQCQRCLGELRVRLVTDTALAVVVSEDQARQLPESYEPLVLSEESVSLNELVEDELLLSLPAFPVHQEGDCKAPEFSSEASEESPVRENPFAVLADLKNRLQ